MSNWELNLGPEYIPPKRKGRFKKGHVPYNKGKKWDEYLPKAMQTKYLKHLKRVQFKKGNPSYRPETAGRPKRKVIAVYDDGRFFVIPSLSKARELMDVSSGVIRECCKKNRARRMLRNKNGKPLNKVNTDYRCRGIRFYYEDDPIWTTKIKNI